jgi:hypothetical protein
MAEAERATPLTAIRVPRSMWAAYGRVCERLGTGRSEDLVDHMRGRILEHGDDQDKADLEAAEQELAERRSRKGGRPPKTR